MLLLARRLLGRARSTPSIQDLLVRLLVVALAPAALAMTAVLAWEHRRERSELEGETLIAARLLVTQLDDRLKHAEFALLELADAFQRNGYSPAELHPVARQVAERDGIDAIVLLGASGAQLMNTRVPFGAALPTRSPPEALKAMQAGRPVVTGVYISPVTQRPLVGIGIPVVKDGTIGHGLNAGLEPTRLLGLLRLQKLPAAWIVTVVDAGGNIVARTHDHAGHVGRPVAAELRNPMSDSGEGVVADRTVNGVSTITALKRSGSSGWSVLVQVPREVLYAPLRRTATLLGLALALLIAGSFALAWFTSRRIRESIGQLIEGTQALARGQAVRLPPLAFAEADQFARSFERASAEIGAANLALAESERRMRGILETAMDAVITMDHAHRVVLFNDAAERMFRCPRQQVLGQPLDSLLPEGARPGHAKLVHAFGASGGGTRSMGSERVVHGRRADGEEFPVEASISSSLDSAGQRWFTVILRDVTERVRDRETLVRSNLELQQFAFVASHDLRGPLRTVKGYLGLLAKRYGAEQPKAQELIARASHATDLMDRLTTDLLSYARLHSESRPLVPVDMQDVVASAVELLRATMEERGARVEVGPLPTVLGDRTQLVQLMQNLIANAVKYCERTPRVEVGARDEGQAWAFWVADNGIGIEPRYQQRIFEIFKRLHTEQEYAGTGIGLAVCQRVVERHGGSIGVSSVPGQGSRFFFTLAKQPGDTRDSRPIPPEAPGSGAAG